MFSKILIANRGEIACRVAATAKRVGIRTVAVYSDADARAKHVVACDEAVRIGGAGASESYLRAESILSAAQRTGSQAIHPGYGFLAENEEFASACAHAGIAFIGPPASAIHAMGSKSAAKALMERAGVPVVPGYHGDNQDLDFLEARANAIGYPVMIKAAAGGGGKGMRMVEEGDRFKGEAASCRREAKNSFGDDRLLIEKYVTRPRHIEIQVFADGQGNCVYLFERDCSVQRRHQKVIEEAPAPGLTQERRTAMGQAAVTAAKAVGYAGAGTVEFLVDQEGNFFFMEMNTRLQVEHPVTELITGLDLVEWQLLVASGSPLPLSQNQLAISGHAIETRIYAENPEKGFVPSTGRLTVFRTPAAAEFEAGRSPGQTPVRVDSGVREGDTITADYDPMIAKVIVWGENRAEALSRAQQALSELVVLGLHTNIAFLQRLLRCPDFVDAVLDTSLIERNQNSLLSSAGPVSFGAIALATAALLKSEQNRRREDPHSPWTTTSGWRLNSNYKRSLRWLVNGEEIEATITYAPSAIRFETGGTERPLSVESDLANHFSLVTGREKISGDVYSEGAVYQVFESGEHTTLEWIDPLTHTHAAETHEGGLTAPMPGKIVAVHVASGDNVKKGAPLIAMEAMKVEYTIQAPTDGIIEEVLFAVGEQVAEGVELLRFVEPGVVEDMAKRR
jgi:3-methylcrotonyl-CoA carboxylase alpha subunit